MEFVGTHQLKNDCVYIDGRSGSYGIVNGLSLGSNPTTQEFVVKIDDRDGYGRIIAENTGLCLSGIGESMFRLYGFGLDVNISSNVIFGGRMSVSLGIGNEKVDHLYLNGESIKKTYTIHVEKSNYPSVVTFFNREAGSRGILVNFAAREYTTELYRIRMSPRTTPSTRRGSTYLTKPFKETNQ